MIIKHLVELPYNHISRDKLNFPMRNRIDVELPLEQAKLKTRADRMTSALIKSELPDKAQAEISKLIADEWKVGKVEHALSNGSNHEEYNPDGRQYVAGNESSSHSRSGLAEQLVDGQMIIEESEVFENDYLMTGIRIQDEISNKNEIDIDVDGQMLTVSNSNYSLWDTIEQMGMLLIRTNAPWKSGTFDSSGWIKYNARRLKLKHNKLLGLADTRVAQGDKRLSNANERRLKRLAKIQARRGGLAKVGYNAFGGVK